MTEYNIKIGESITNDKLAKMFKVSTQGGMRKSNRTNSLILIQKTYQELYPDKINWNNHTVDYIGMGQSGDQDINFAQNKTLANSKKNNIDVHLFINDKPNNYIYYGRVSMLNAPQIKTLMDGNEIKRKMIVFNLRMIALSNFEYLTKLKKQYKIIMNNKHSTMDKKANKIINYKNKAARIKKLISYDKRYEYNFLRNNIQETKDIKVNVNNPYTAALAKILANGKCQLCGKDAPFKDKNNNPYLETHHIKPLSENGMDSIFNLTALCPNCHCKMHILQKHDDIEFLQYRANKLANNLNIQKSF